MNRADASFTFLHRVEEVEQNIEDGRWQSALALALTLPDICGGIAFPEVVKRYRDGRVMLDRQKNPTRDVGGQYVQWFDAYAAPYFKLSPTDEAPYICGQRCWQLRCEYLHQNKGFVNEEGDDGVRFHLGVNCGTSVCRLSATEPQSDGADIRIDIKQFCLRMCQAARSYYDAAHQDRDFSLYNTPVLDFVQAVREADPGPVIAVVCENQSYGRALARALLPITDRAVVFHSPAAARKHFGKAKPHLWIVAHDLLQQSDRPWQADKTTPVLLLTKPNAPVPHIPKEKGRLSAVPLPVHPHALRAYAEQLIQEV